jgi:hypothetical protein
VKGLWLPSKIDCHAGHQNPVILKMFAQPEFVPNLQAYYTFFKDTTVNGTLHFLQNISMFITIFFGIGQQPLTPDFVEVVLHLPW